MTYDSFSFLDHKCLVNRGPDYGITGMIKFWSGQDINFLRVEIQFYSLFALQHLIKPDAQYTG